MSYQPPPQPGYQMPPPPRRRRRTGRTVAITVGAVVAVFIAIVVIGAALTAKPEHHAARSASPVTSAAPAATTTTPTVADTPNPDGTYSGSCDYTLSDNFSSGTAGTLVGEVDLRNTGNIGTVDRVRITWPQEGFAPIARTRTVHVPAGKSMAVRFHVPASQNMIAELQSWQERHNLRDGCTYHAAITGTLGGTAH